jgi:hypothetical protein
MTLYTDIPTRAEIDALWNAAFPTSVSLYVPTEPASSGEAEQIAFKNLARAALDQLAGADKNDLAAVEEALADLGEDDAFWRRQARTLAVFATPAWLRTFRLPNRLIELAVGGERLYVKPLMRAVTFPQTAFVLALAQGGVRLLETVPDAPPALVRVPDMPSDVATAAGKASIKDRAPIRRLQGDEGQKVRIRQYARRVDDALREVLPGTSGPPGDRRHRATGLDLPVGVPLSGRGAGVGAGQPGVRLGRRAGSGGQGRTGPVLRGKAR